MARYGGEIERHRMGLHDFAEQGGGYGGQQGYRSGGRGDYRRSEQGPGQGGAGMIGGMRSDAGGTRWDRFPGEEGWFGQGYAGYPGGDVRGGGRGYGGDYRTGRGSGDRQQRFVGPWGGRYGGDYRSGFGQGGGRNQTGRAQQGLSDADRVRARDVMTDNPECVTPDTSVTDVAKRMRDLNVGIIPVVDDKQSRRLRGVITDRDLAIRVLADGKDGKAKVGDYMTEQLNTVNQNDTVHDILDVMKREQVRRVPVTDREGRLVGVVAQADLAVSYAGLDLQRETEVEEAIERISEPARPRGR
jgi:CBS domain-containing protein